MYSCRQTHRPSASPPYSFGYCREISADNVIPLLSQCRCHQHVRIRAPTCPQQYDSDDADVPPHGARRSRRSCSSCCRRRRVSDLQSCTRCVHSADAPRTTLHCAMWPHARACLWPHRDGARHAASDNTVRHAPHAHTARMAGALTHGRQAETNRAAHELRAQLGQPCHRLHCEHCQDEVLAARPCSAMLQCRYSSCTVIFNCNRYSSITVCYSTVIICNDYSDRSVIKRCNAYETAVMQIENINAL